MTKRILEMKTLMLTSKPTWLRRDDDDEVEEEGKYANEVISTTAYALKEYFRVTSRDAKGNKRWERRMREDKL